MKGKSLDPSERAQTSIAAVLASVVLVGCGGAGDEGNAAPRTGACTLANAADVPATGRLVFESGFEVPSLLGLGPQDAAGRISAGPGRTAAEGSGAPRRGGRTEPRVLAGWCALAVLAWFHTGFLRSAKGTLDWQAAVISLTEHALRAGRIGPADIGVAPFGFQGWHLYPYFVRRDGADGAYIAGFVGYLAADSLKADASKAGRGPAPDGRVEVPSDPADPVVAKGVFGRGWRRHALYHLRRTGRARPPALAIDPTSYRLEPFPLNDAEWRALVARAP